VRSRQKILQSTLALIEREGFGAVTMARVAVAAGVSRQTVYSIFGSREDLVSQVVVGVATDLMSGIQSRLAPIEGPAEYVTELMIAARATFREHPVFGELLRPDDGNPVFDKEMMARAKPVSLQLLRSLADRHPELTGRMEDIAEMATRIGLSILLFDSDAVHTDDELRAFLGRWLTPVLEPAPAAGSAAGQSR
jgi:AcrR family transcriptional regulator